ncbi:MAG: hypothetical protein JO331_00115 [Verrucomicrobia bacterium]|nr:hypothetical protein [Verrucomicrobiota bacterium]
MIVPPSDPYRVVYQKFDFGPYNLLFVQECGGFIAHKNEKLGSAGQLQAVRPEVVA